MVSVAPPNADASAGLLRRVIKEPAHLLRIKTGGTPRRRRGPHGSDQIVGFFHSRASGPHGPQCNVVAERDSPQEMRSTDTELLACSQRCGYDGASRMRSSCGEVVVGFIGMRELAIGECRFDRSTEDV